MDLAAIKHAVDDLSFGKRLPTARYVWDDGAGDALPPLLRAVCGELRRRLELGAEFNVLKFHTDRPKLSFLAYPDFFVSPHPTLAGAVVVDLASGKVRRDTYAGRANPPILHRKETFLPPEHPERERFATLTAAEERAGLLTGTATIGFRLNWERLLAERGFIFKEHRLVAVTPPSTATKSDAEIVPPVQRHRTALARAAISKPVKTLLEHTQLRKGESFFDYGCGLGADVRALSELGYDATGWDPVHAREGERLPADVVNLGFVLNVIEDPAERVDVLAAAWQLTRRLLVVSTLISGQEGYHDFRCLNDGVLTSRNTFQKYFEPAELQAMLEDSLGVSHRGTFGRWPQAAPF